MKGLIKGTILTGLALIAMSCNSKITSQEQCRRLTENTNYTTSCETKCESEQILYHSQKHGLQKAAELAEKDCNKDFYILLQDYLRGS